MQMGYIMVFELHGREGLGLNMIKEVLFISG